MACDIGGVVVRAFRLAIKIQGLAGSACICSTLRWSSNLPLSLGSIIWYWTVGGDGLWLGI